MPNQRTAIRILSGCALSVALLAACEKGDPLADIRQRQATGDWEGSIEPLREVLAERPEDPEANYLYGQALVATQRPALASWALRKAMEDPNWTVPAGLQLAYAGLATADFNEVVIAADRVLEREPENTAALLARANAHAYWRRDPAQALADAERVIEIDPDSIDASKPRILALLLLERYDEAHAALDELGHRIDETDAPEHARAWHCATTAIFANDSGDLDRGQQLFRECLEKFPTQPDVVHPALRFYDEHGQGARSIEVLRAALAAPDLSAADASSFRNLLAERLRLAGEVAEGEALLREATENEDGEIAAAAWMDLGRYRRSAGEPVGAAEAMERALALADETKADVPPQIWFEYAEALLLAKQYERALEVADDLSVPAHQHVIRARVAQERGNSALALEEFTKAFRIWPDNPWARYYAARAAEDLGDFDRAAEEYRSSIRIDPAATDARTRAARLLLAEGKPRLAAQMARELQGAPIDLEGQLLGLRIQGRFGTPEEMKAAQERFKSGGVTLTALATATMAKGIAEGSGGPAAALRFLRGAPGLDFSDPADAEALREIVRFSHESGQHATPPELSKAIAAHRDVAAFEEIRGLDLELRGGQDEAARAAYARALELDPRNVGALMGLARLTRESDPAQAVAYLDRAAAADPSDPEPALDAARLLAARGEGDEAAKRLDALLLRHPYEGEAAALRAQIDLDHGEATARTLERARRAVRFSGGVEALELLGRVHAERGEKDQAAQVAQRVRALREKARGGASPAEGDEEPELTSPSDDRTG
jgi:tetratricopeptide (TPR) repeat protein